MKIALAQINAIVGDIAGNAAKIRRAIREASAAGARLAVFPELAIIGYPPRDLLLKPIAIDRCVEAVEELARDCTETAAIIGYPCPSTAPRGRRLYNAAAFCHQGRIVKRHIKSLLPTYDVFDEQRYFEPGPAVDLTDFAGQRLGVSICEDLWNEPEFFDPVPYHANPAQAIAAAGATMLINASASPFVVGKPEFRHRLFSHTAKRFKLPLLHVNQVGGNDELIFDGNSCAFDGQGNLIAQAKDFEEDLLLVDLDALPGTVDGVNRIHVPRRGLESMYHALVLGLRDYCFKCGFNSIVLGLSGGVDSALTAALAVGALGSHQVRGIAMPSRFSSPGSVADARELARRLGIQFDIIPIDPAHRAFEAMFEPVFDALPQDVTEENVQARVRGVTLMAMSNKFHSLLVTTGNKSELAVGYCTLYGDMAGGLAVLSDVPKTSVWALSRWINESSASPLRQSFGGPVIPENSIAKVPSAELRPDQTDQDTLPPYEVLDPIVERYVEREHSAQQIIRDTGYDPQIVARVVGMIDRNEYKRKQMPPGLKVTGRAFGVGRRMPIAQRFGASLPPVAST